MKIVMPNDGELTIQQDQDFTRVQYITAKDLIEARINEKVKSFEQN